VSFMHLPVNAVPVIETSSGYAWRVSSFRFRSLNKQWLSSLPWSLMHWYSNYAILLATPPLSLPELYSLLHCTIRSAKCGTALCSYYKYSILGENRTDSTKSLHNHLTQHGKQTVEHSNTR